MGVDGVDPDETAATRPAVEDTAVAPDAVRTEAAELLDLA